MANHRRKHINPGKVVDGQGYIYTTYNNKVVQAKLPYETAISAGDSYLDKVMADVDLFRPTYSGVDRIFDVDYYGRAFCNENEGDTFDFVEGQKIARKRCQETFFKDFDSFIIKLLEELHIVECRIFNRLRKSGKLDVYKKARSVAQMYDDNIRMPGQKEFSSYF